MAPVEKRGFSKEGESFESCLDCMQGTPLILNRFPNFAQSSSLRRLEKDGDLPQMGAPCLLIS